MTDVDFYKLVTPAASAPQTLVATVTPSGSSKLDPNITVFDALGNETNAEI